MGLDTCCSSAGIASYTLSASSGARGLQPPEPAGSVQWCAGSSPWQRLRLIMSQKEMFCGEELSDLSQKEFRK